MNENKIKNKNKAIILVIIMLIILTLSTTIAYFTASSTKSTENIITADINNTLNFSEEEVIMNPELIPLKEEDLLTAINNNCKDSTGYDACSSYKFSVENISNVAQEIKLSLIPTVNTFENLYFIILDITNVEESSNIESLPKKGTKLNYNDLNNIEMANNILINSNRKKTYKIIFYIKALGIDQTTMDAGKSFGAGIRVDSITTGQYLTDLFGPSCWNSEYINYSVGEYKLTAFSGINEDGTINESCTGYVQQDEVGLYSINVPSNVGGNEITTLGNNLFNSIERIDAESGMPILNKYVNIKKIDIAEGITTIEDGYINDTSGVGTFLAIGFDFETGYPIENRELEVNLPNSLTYIGTTVFSNSALKEITIPSNVESIGEGGFATNSNLTKVTFMGAEDNTSKLKTIGNNAFSGCNLTYGESNPLLIPSSVESIGKSAFSINNNLTKVTFMGVEDNTSKLKTIGESAFSDCNLTYGESNPLEIPSIVTLIGNQAFYNNRNLTHIRYLGSYSATNWYNSSVTTIIKE